MRTLAPIVEAFGGDLSDGGRRALLPGPGHSRADRSVSLYLCDDGRILIHCFSPRDDWRTVRDLLATAGFIDTASRPRAVRGAQTRRAAVAQPASEDRRVRARRLWRESAALAGTAAEHYLLARSAPPTFAAVAGAAPALRFHRAMSALDDRRRRPALMSAIVDARGELQGVEATLIDPRGPTGPRKADVATPRRVIGRLMGGAVRLEPAGTALVVAEGVETAICAAHAFGAPAWALLSAANLARFAPPIGVDRLIVAADADSAGQTAARMLRDRLGRVLDEVVIETPPPGFNDWNDVARARRLVK